VYGDDDFYQRFQDRLTDMARAEPIWMRALIAAVFALFAHTYVSSHHWRWVHANGAAYFAAMLGFGLIEALQMVINWIVYGLILAGAIWLFTKIME
jgi:hypothetical protein